MLTVTVVGLKKSGKTTTVEGLIHEFKSRGYKVASVKVMMHSRFTIDAKGKDTVRHKEAGADSVVSLSNGEMAYIQALPRPASFKDALRVIPTDTDIVICEGLRTDDPNVLKIVTAASSEELPETFKVRCLGSGKGVIALAGIMANKTKKHPKFPVFDCTKPKQVKDLVDLILKRGKTVK